MIEMDYRVIVKDILLGMVRNRSARNLEDVLDWLERLADDWSEGYAYKGAEIARAVEVAAEEFDNSRLWDGIASRASEIRIDFDARQMAHMG